MFKVLAKMISKWSWRNCK